jgi:hypothetical protein
LESSNSKITKLIRRKLIWTGQQVHYYNTSVNRRIFRLDSKDPIKALPEEKALEKGAEFFSEIIIYSILISFPLYEWYKTRVETKEKEQRKKFRIKKMENDIVALNKQLAELKQQLNEIKINYI